MKRIVLTGAIIVFLGSCNNASDTTAAKKDSLDSVASEQKQKIDSVAQEKIDNIDSTTKQKKAALDSLDSLKKINTSRVND